jgi:EmrB/QacA subfamily drug resistance transporter
MRDPRRWWILAVLSLSLVVISLDNTILNVALPAMKADLGASASQLQWIVDAYMLVFAGLLLTAGSLGDRFGRKRVLTAGLAIFGAASAGAALVHDPGALIALRALMGVGGAAIMPSTLSIITNVFDEAERPKAIGIWAAVASLGIVIGPVSGGALVEHASWHWVFLVNVPLVLVALAAGRRLIPESRDPAAPPLDLLGALLSVVGLGALVWAIIEAPDRGWTDAPILAAFGLAAVMLAAFAAWERRTAHPMLDLRFFGNPRFSASSAAISLAFFALFGTLFATTQYLQVVLERGPLSAGLWTMPLAVGMMASAPHAARLAGRVGTKPVVSAGMVVLAGGLAWLSRAGVDWGFWAVAGPQVAMGLGMGLAMAPATDAIMGSLPPEHASVGSAVNDTNRVVGGAMGVAILGSLLSSGYRGAMDDATQGLPASAAAAAHDSVGGAAAVAGQLGGPAGRALHGAASTAFVDALSSAALVASGVTLAAAVVALLWLPSRAAERVALEHAEAEAEAVAA